MEVILAIGPIAGTDNDDDPSLYQRVSASADSYEAALTLAREKVPEGFRILNIRTDE
ncbi:hypothetical protein [Paenarthrobacter sp. YJN-5]|uniref:hypothetical protein n=1 Tax=Paenarthrobacter sp. YJN-5 TaxID=2735316 RepID=UPI00187834AB|nr:hypothetical protein [Paenarthrobacter sp. YJN-5]QOT16685.1 hypothetical protein HMI59_08810 [Paenarthrobacter sp. YJN-5]